MPNPQDLKDMYLELGINIDDLGCIMLDTEPLKVSDIITEDELYYANDPENHSYVNGIVSETVPHLTLLWGLLKSGREYKQYVDRVLEGWSIKSVNIENVGAFESRYDNEAYFCLVAHLKLTNELKDGNNRLKMLPNVQGFPDYLPHITLAYIKPEAALRDELLYALNNRFVGRTVKVKELNYGD